jgi:hypothetical protein
LVNRYCAGLKFVPRIFFDFRELQKLGGWKTLLIAMRYAHTNVAEHAHRINRLSGGNLEESPVKSEHSS